MRGISENEGLKGEGEGMMQGQCYGNKICLPVLIRYPGVNLILNQDTRILSQINQKYEILHPGLTMERCVRFLYFEFNPILVDNFFI